MDAQLVARALDGDREAFTALATATYGRLHRVAQNTLGDLDRAEDATQQAVVDIWRKLPQLRDAGRFEAWPLVGPSSRRAAASSCRSDSARSGRFERFVRGLVLMRNRAETYLGEGLSTLGFGRAASLCAHI